MNDGSILLCCGQVVSEALGPRGCPNCLGDKLAKRLEVTDVRRMLQGGQVRPTRSRSYLDWVKRQPCVDCGAPADDPHHRYGAGWSKGIGTKVSDLWTIPLCRQHHDELHRSPEAWEERNGSQWFWVCIMLEFAASQGVIEL